MLIIIDYFFKRRNVFNKPLFKKNQKNKLFYFYFPSLLYRTIMLLLQP